MNDYHPYLDGPAEPIGLAMRIDETQPQRTGPRSFAEIIHVRRCVADYLNNAGWKDHGGYWCRPDGGVSGGSIWAAANEQEGLDVATYIRRENALVKAIEP